MNKVLSFLLLLFFGVTSDPTVTAWILNCDGTTGYGGAPADVQSVHFDNDSAYVSASGIPSYDIGPWGPNPNQASDQAAVFKIPRAPQPATGTHMNTPLGPIGVFTNGVALYNALDAWSWHNQGVWNQDAVFAEAISFDSCLGHPQNAGQYHHHQVPVCLLNQVGDDGSAHSAIVGYAFDGFPVYGPYGYFNPTDPTSAITPMETSYRLRNISVRHVLPDGTVLGPPLWGPDVDSWYPLGLYVEDYEYIAGLGHLDEYNGRFTVTPDYPQGTFAYFVTLRADGSSTYPYMLGPRYYGVPDTDNIGPFSNVQVPPGADEYNGCDPCQDPVSFCTSTVNSSSATGAIGASGTPSIAANDFTLSAWGIPPNQPGIFFYGPNQVQMPLGDGFRCVGGNIYRLPPTSTTIWGDVTYDLDIGSPPSASGQIADGSTWNFQFWFRDPAAQNMGHNLTDGLSVSFCP
jgi:hypothetical protein